MMFRRPPWQFAHAGALDVAALAWVVAVCVNGGTVSAARATLVSNLIASLRASGSWALRDDCWLPAAENSVQARTSLKQRRLATITGSPVFTADRGFLQDGAASFLNTGFIPSTHGVAMTGTDARIECYEITNVALSSSYAAGCSNSSTQNCYVNPCTAVFRAGVGLGNNGSAAAGQVFLPVADSRGLVGGQRSGTTLTYDKNGASFGSLSPTFGASLATVALYIGALNNGGVAANFRPTAISWLSVGASLTAAQLAADYAALQAYMTALGANV